MFSVSFFYCVSLLCYENGGTNIYIIGLSHIRAEIYFYQGGDAASLAVAENYVKVGQF